MIQTRQLAAIMFTDIVGYSTLMGKDEDGAMQLLDLSRQLQKKIVAAHEGKWIKELGDGVIIVFDSVLNAVKCAVDIQDQARAIENLALKIAIHSGEILLTEKDVFGDSVNLTSRIEQLAQKDCIILSGTALSAIINIASIQTSYLGDFTLKNIQLPVSLYAVVGDGLRIPALNDENNQRQVLEEDPPDITSKDDPLVRRAKATIEKNLANSKLSVTYLCRELGISRPQLYRRIQSETGFAPSDFIREIRLQEASRLLKDDENNVSQVAYQTGFNNLSYFSKCFHERFKTTPSDYRRNHLQKFAVSTALNKLIGREKEVAEIIEIMGRARLLTMTGMGGTGKSRLANEILRKRGGHFHDGAYFISLAPISVPAAVIPKIAQTLKIQQDPTRHTLNTIIDHIDDKEILLILDNFEHVLPAANQINQLLLSCANLKVLVTSREVLNVAGEFEYVVPQLSLPGDSGLPIKELIQFSAIALLIERIQAVKPNFELTVQNKDSITAICRSLDGLPLALELAAARFKIFSADALSNRLINSMDILSSKSTSQPERHRTLRNTIDWSYNLLSPEEQTLFRRLSIFSGGFTIDAAEMVCFQGYQDSLEIVDHLTSLVDKSLLQREDQNEGEPRFFLLETIKSYGLDKLKKAGEKESIMEFYVKFYQNILEDVEKHLTGPKQGMWCDKIETELDNLRAILTWLEERKEAHTGLSIAVSFWRFWTLRSMMREGSRWLDRILHIPSDNPDTIIRCRALNAYGILFGLTRNPSDSHSIFMESLTIARKIGIEKVLGETLNNLAWTAHYMHDYKTCKEASLEAQQILKKLDDRRGISVSYANLGLTALCRGRLSQAEDFYKKGAAIRRDIGDSRGYAYNLTNLAWSQTHMGKYEEASHKLDVADNILQEIGDRQLLAWMMTIRAISWFDGGVIDKAWEITSKCLPLWKGSGNTFGYAYCILIQIQVLLAKGEKEKAAKLLDQIKNDDNRGIYGYNVFLFRIIGALVALAIDDTATSSDLARKGLVDCMETGSNLFICDFLELMVQILVQKGSYTSALMFLSQSTKLRIAGKHPIPPIHQEMQGQTLAQLRSYFKDLAFDDIWSRGQKLNTKECLALFI